MTVEMANFCTDPDCDYGPIAHSHGTAHNLPTENLIRQAIAQLGTADPSAARAQAITQLQEALRCLMDSSSAKGPAAR